MVWKKKSKFITWAQESTKKLKKDHIKTQTINYISLCCTTFGKRESYKYPMQTYEINIMGTVNILDISFKSNFVRSLVCVTTDKVYENKNWVWGYRENDNLGGDDPYSASKAAAEIAINSYRNSFFINNKNIGVASVRAGNSVMVEVICQRIELFLIVSGIYQRKNIIVQKS